MNSGFTVLSATEKLFYLWKMFFLHVRLSGVHESSTARGVPGRCTSKFGSMAWAMMRSCSSEPPLFCHSERTSCGATSRPQFSTICETLKTNCR